MLSWMYFSKLGTLIDDATQRQYVRRVHDRRRHSLREVCVRVCLLGRYRRVQRLFEYIEDGDLWTWKLPHSKQFAAYVTPVGWQCDSCVSHPYHCRE